VEQLVLRRPRVDSLVPVEPEATSAQRVVQVHRLVVDPRATYWPRQRVVQQAGR